MNFASACQDFLLCKLNPDYLHILREPRVLPCGFTICLNCIKMNTNDNVFENCLCKNSHSIPVIEDLPRNVLIEGILSVNEKVGGGKVVEDFNNKLAEFEDMIENTDKYMDTHMNFLEEEVNIRAESLRNDIDTLAENFIKRLQEKKFDYLKDLCRFSKDVKGTVVEFRKYVDRISKNPVINDDDAQRIKLYTEKTNEMYKTYHDIINRFSVFISDWSPTSFIIARMDKIDDQVDVNRFKKASPKVLRVNFDAAGMCAISKKKLAIVAHTGNAVHLMNENFEQVDNLSTIGRNKVCTPVGIACDDKGEYICICNYRMQEVLICDAKFDNVIKALPKDNFVLPVDACFHSGKLYIVDQRKTYLQIFSYTGDFIECMRLTAEFSETYDPMERLRLVNGPVRISCIESTIGIIDDWKLVYLYNLEGQLKQIINPFENKSVETFCFSNAYLYLHCKDGRIACYENCYEKEGEQRYSSLFTREFSNLDMGSSYMTVWNGYLLISFCNDRKLAVI